tara:strand:+ start:785 stop:1027 length:243 start_codon:yes stop_codon:yes gene_type:complete
MADEIKVGDWVIGTEAWRTFRVYEIVEDGEFKGYLVNKWGTMHPPELYRKYTGATSALEDAEAGMDRFMQSVGLMPGEGP